jgi:hypothetical protein
MISHMGHAYASRCMYSYRVHLIAPRASGNVSNAMCLRVCVGRRKVRKVQAPNHMAWDGGGQASVTQRERPSHHIESHSRSTPYLSDAAVGGGDGPVWANTARG